MLRPIAVLSLLAVAGAPARGTEPPRPAARAILAHMGHGDFRTPGIRVWTSGSDLVRRGERVRVFYRTERDAYVTIFRVDTDGHVRLLFPRTPDEENYGYGGATYTVSSAGNGTAFYVDDYAGVGYIFGIASTAPFNYDAIYDQGHWDLHAIGDGRIHGDPLTSLEELSGRLLPESFGDYDTHLLPYYVEQRYSYPRFVCYDCHSYVPYTYWDPYLAWCRRYTLVVWNDPYYYYPSYWYPTRYYGGTRVVYTSPGGSRYVFKNRDNAAPGIDYRDRRSTAATVNTGGRRVDDGNVRGTDIGGVGSVPAPRTPNRRIGPVTGSGGVGGADQPRDPRSGDGAAPGALGGGVNEGRRRVDAGPEAPQAPTPVPSDAGGRRRGDARPGIEIVPRPERPQPDAAQPARPQDGSQPARPQDPRRARPEGEGGTRRTPGEPFTAVPTPEPPVLRPAEPNRQGDEPRPPRPDGVVRPGPIDVRRPNADQPQARPEPQRKPEESPKPAAQPDRRPETRPERTPESRPERAPESRPESRPQAQPRAPESRPQASPPKSNPPARSPGLVRRRGNP